MTHDKDIADTAVKNRFIQRKLFYYFVFYLLIYFVYFILNFIIWI